MNDTSRESPDSLNGPDRPPLGADSSARESVKSEFRRRLLLGGAAAVPLVVTVATPRRGFAQQTSALCISKFADVNGVPEIANLEVFIPANTSIPNFHTRSELWRQVYGPNVQIPSFPSTDPLDTLIASPNCLLSNGIEVVIDVIDTP